MLQVFLERAKEKRHAYDALDKKEHKARRDDDVHDSGPVRERLNIDANVVLTAYDRLKYAIQHQK
jgi:hypothetical protein